MKQKCPGAIFRATEQKVMVIFRKIFYPALLIIFILFAWLYWDGSLIPSPPEDESENEGIPAETRQEMPASPAEPSFRRATVAAVGDIMVHKTQYLRAYDPQTGSFDFGPSFEVIAPLLQEADLIVGNLETTFGGEKRGFSAYPRFNSPDEVVRALREAGFDLLCTANNHCLDTGEQGLYRTIEIVEGAGMKHFGTARSPQERDSLLTVEVKGIRLCFLAYTYGTNGLPIPEGREYIVNLLAEGRMEADIAAARRSGADLIILYLHWGEEYHPEPSEEQKRLARVAAQAGADIILGCHPHVVQPMEYIEVSKNGSGFGSFSGDDGGDGEDKRVFVAYSLGNFLSNQHRVAGSISTDEVEFGLILYLHLEKDMSSGRTSLRGIDYKLTWVHREDRHRILPFDGIEAVSLPVALQGRLGADGARLRDRLQGFGEAAACSSPGDAQ